MLQHWFSPVSNNVFKTKDQSLGISAQFVCTDIENNHQNKIALITSDNGLFSDFRSIFYSMPNHFSSVTVIDFGALANPSHDSFIQLHKELISSQIIPIYLGFKKSFVSSVLKAQENIIESQECCIIAKNLSLIEQIHELEVVKVPKLNPIGFQTHLCFPRSLEAFPSSYLANFRLGKIRSNLSVTEPIIRQSDSLVLNLNVLRKSDLPELTDASPSALFSEELSQLGKYIGLSEQCKSILILGADELKTTQGKEMLAQLIWYIYEGSDNKFDEKIDENDINFTSYSVESNSQNTPLKFIKSLKSGKWWVQHLENENKFIACSYQDYVMTCNDDIPERILNHCFK